MGLTVDERLDTLLHTKWTVTEFDNLLTREMVDLIDREGDMLNRCVQVRGVSPGSGMMKIREDQDRVSGGLVEVRSQPQSPVVPTYS